ncbi:hypothetical protein DRE_03709 [Drechslerella stenobrocha 248]|uniref:Centromere protein H C-terminal domain-containing protein n=1 Tax=Drechslerella stenobrocha 248 TaxID=1043628 RepID=W7I3G8_9PEZI|nr:hypothetical protein DRE_03709 [Drechslerella stenobrocha 248]
MTAKSLHSSCVAIITELMQHRIGFPVLPPTSVTTDAALRDLIMHQDSDALAAYDRLQDLTLRKCLLEAEVEALQDALAHDSMDVDDTTSLDATSKDTREIQGKTLVKDLVITHMVSTRPIVRAIHSGPNRTKLETELLPLLTTRDLLATTLLHLTSQLSNLQRTYTTAASSLIAHTDRNKDLAEQLRQLSAANEFTEAITTNEAVIAKKAKLATEQRRCETLKGVVQGIIVGSGVNWSEDEALQRLVLECGDV